MKTKIVDGVELYPYHTSSGDFEWVTVEVNVYHSNDNLYVGLLHYDPEEKKICRYGSVTTNRIGMPYLYAAIDSDKNGPAIIPFLVQNGFGKDTGKCVSSGHMEYPIFKFSEEKLREACPEEFAIYEKERKGNALRDAQAWKVPSQLESNASPISELKQSLAEKIEEAGKTKKKSKKTDRGHLLENKDVGSREIKG